METNQAVEDDSIGSIKDNPFLSKSRPKNQASKRQRRVRASTRHNNSIQSRIRSLHTVEESKGDSTSPGSSQLPPSIIIPSDEVAPSSVHRRKKFESNEQQKKKQERKIRASMRHNNPVADRMKIMQEKLKNKQDIALINVENRPKKKTLLMALSEEEEEEEEEVPVKKDRSGGRFSRRTCKHVRIDDKVKEIRRQKWQQKQLLEEKKDEIWNDVIADVTRKPVQLWGESSESHQQRVNDAIDQTTAEMMKRKVQGGGEEEEKQKEERKQVNEEQKQDPKQQEGKGNEKQEELDGKEEQKEDKKPEQNQKQKHEEIEEEEYDDDESYDEYDDDLSSYSEYSDDDDEYLSYDESTDDDVEDGDVDKCDMKSLKISDKKDENVQVATTATTAKNEEVTTTLVEDREVVTADTSVKEEQVTTTSMEGEAN